MATIPDGATAYPSPAGLGAARPREVDGCTLFSMPGPPARWRRSSPASWRTTSRRAGAHRAVTHRAGVDMWESEVSPMLQQVMEAVPGTYCKGTSRSATSGSCRSTS